MKIPVLLPNIFNHPFTYDDRGLNLKKGDYVEIPFRKIRKRDSSSHTYSTNGHLIIVGDDILSNTSNSISKLTEPLQGLYSTYRIIELISD